MFCSQCGSENSDQSRFCSSCGAPLSGSTRVNFSYSSDRVNPNAKSKIGAALLAIFLGVWGIHNFYLGYKNKAIIQLLLGTIGIIILVGPLISSVWGFFEGIMILVGNIDRDADGEFLI